MWSSPTAIALGLLAAGCAAAGGEDAALEPPAPREPARTVTPPPPEPEPGLDPDGLARLEGYFPNVELRDQHGQGWRFYDDLIRDRTVLINFMYTACDGL